MLDIEISVVIPVYGSQDTLEELYERLSSQLELITYSYEIILVNDNSPDSSYEIMEQIRKRDKRVKIIRLMKNFGQHNAIMCGFNYSVGEYVVTMDDDLQNPPEEIHRMMSKIKEGFDVVIGKAIDKKHASYRNLGSYLIGLSFAKIFKKPRELKMSSFRILRKSLVQTIIKSKTPNPMIDALILSNTSRVINIEVKHDVRKHGTSNYTLFKSVKLAFDLLINYSTIPLQFISLNGFVFAIIGVLIAIYAIIGKIFGFIIAPGYTSIIALISIFSGLIMVSFGVVGEYLTRIIGEVAHFRQYVIAESSYQEEDSSKEVASAKS